MFSSHARSLLLWRFHLRRLRFINTQNVTVGTRGWLHKNLWKSINHSSVTYYKNIRCLMLKAKIWMIKKFWHLHIYIGLVLKWRKKEKRPQYTIHDDSIVLLQLDFRCTCFIFMKGRDTEKRFNITSWSSSCL